MIEIKCDLFEYIKTNEVDAICCTTNMVVKQNGELVMGAGIAKEFANRYPTLPKIFGDWIKQESSRTSARTYLVTEFQPQCIYFPTKIHWKNPSKLWLIEKSLKELVMITDYNKFNIVVLPRPGCSNGGLDWESQVKPLCEQYLDDRFIVISL